MTTNKASGQQSKTKQVTDNPLTDLAGKFGGKFWLETFSEIERSRKTDREETNKLLDTNKEIR